MGMRTSDRGIALIKKWEGLYLTAYLDSVNVWTIGWGTITNPDYGIRVYEGLKITREQAEEWLRIEQQDIEKKISALVKVPLTQDQFDVLSSFCYNVGVGALASSTLLRLLNRGNYDAVPAQLNRFVYGDGRVIQGLVNRRRDEGRMWRGEHVDAIPDTPIVRVPAEKITPAVAEAPVKTTLQSGTGQAALSQLVLAIGAASQFIQNPAVVASLLAVAGISGYIFWRKYHDTMEMR